MANYDVFVPNEIEKEIVKSVKNLSKKEYLEFIKFKIGDEVFEKNRYTIYKNDDYEQIIYFKDKIKNISKGSKYLIPIYSILRTFIKNDTDINIFLFNRLKAIIIFIGNKLEFYELGFENQQNLLMEATSKKKEYQINYSDSKKINFFSDFDIENIESKKISIQNIDISTIPKNEILRKKSFFSNIFEKMNIKFKKDLSIKTIFDIFLKYSANMVLIVVITITLYQNYKISNYLNNVDMNRKNIEKINKNILKILSTMNLYNKNKNKNKDKNKDKNIVSKQDNKKY